jgi:hypothetical protein
LPLHPGLHCRLGEGVELGVELFVVDFSVVAVIERRDTLLDRKHSQSSLSASSARRCWSARMASRMASLALRYSPLPASYR